MDDCAPVGITLETFAQTFVNHVLRLTLTDIPHFLEAEFWPAWLRARFGGIIVTAASHTESHSYSTGAGVAKPS